MHPGGRHNLCPRPRNNDTTAERRQLNSGGGSGGHRALRVTSLDNDPVSRLGVIARENYGWKRDVQRRCNALPYTLLNFCTKCEGKFVPDSPTNNVATEHVQCTAAAGLGWWENRISSRLCQPIRGKLWFWKLCVNQWQVACGSMPPVGQLRVTFFKKCVLTWHWDRVSPSSCHIYCSWSQLAVKMYFTFR